MRSGEYESKPLPSVCEAYQRITGIDPRASKDRPAANTVAVPCVNKPGHRHGDSKPSLHIDTVKDVWTCRVCTESGGKNSGGRSVALVVHSGLARDVSEASKWLCPIERKEKRPPPPIDQRRVAARYPYHDADGTVLYEVIRYEWDYVDENGETKVDKTFGQRAFVNGSWLPKLDGVQRVPYRYIEMLEAINQGKTVYFVEGEKDVEALNGIGLPATTSAQGATWRWTTEFIECFRGAPSVVVIGDNDEAGKAAAHRRAELLNDVCGAVRVVESIPGVAWKGDAFDWISAYRKEHPEASAAQVAMKFKTAIKDEAKLVSAQVDDGSLRAWDFTTLHFQILATQQPPKVGIMTGIRALDDREAMNGLQPKETTILAARTNVGKTLVMEHMIVSAWEHFKVLIFALEMGAEKMHDRIVSRAQSYPVKDYRMRGRPDIAFGKEWYQAKNLRIVGKTRLATPEAMIDVVEQFCPDLVVIDHLRHINGWHDRTGKLRQDLAAAECLDKLMAAAAKFGHHNLFCSQITRDANGRRPELSDLRDSGSVEEAADNVIMLHRPYKSLDGARRSSSDEDDIMEAILRKSREAPEINAHMRFIGPLMALENLTDENFGHYTRCCA